MNKHNIDNEPFFNGSGLVAPDEDQVTDVRTNTWGGYTGLAEEGLKSAWANADARRAQHSERMKRAWAEGTIKPHVTTDELRAKRTAALKQAWADGKYAKRGKK